MEYPSKLKKDIMEQSKNFQLEGFLPGRGAENADVMLVAEAPGKTEIKTQVPFSGQAGKGLDTALDRIDLHREDIYMTSVVRCRPYSVKKKGEKQTYPNRTPSKTEIRLFAPLFDFEVATVQPKIIVAMGNSALKRLLGNHYNISSYHGQTLQQSIYKLSKDRKNYEETKESYMIFPMYHPAAILYNRNLKETMSEDWARLSELIQKVTTEKSE
ncbi:uracil-DNA glycosylase [Tetragenococcus osmophilus]|uniref:DNA polymerase n=1 Tax=Tetragenococcus osmophilus TaxID=526944 RepID=A0AA38CW43_9ENTE|nr:uracil-DNA glycosylase [Tetragenococcus osmophilus]AYW47816.1 uracil-DNA glycosylase [Tetragenococcus osmophilus]GMA53507.1 DNA polymerase [Alicyclobacillus contaminans]GMA72548.1 DNA polymerase [Tetragenococcus osmophilus]